MYDFTSNIVLYYNNYDMHIKIVKAIDIHFVHITCLYYVSQLLISPCDKYEISIVVVFNSCGMDIVYFFCKIDVEQKQTYSNSILDPQTPFTP